MSSVPDFPFSPFPCRVFHACVYVCASCSFSSFSCAYFWASEPLASGVDAVGESTGFIAANMDESNCVGPVTAPVNRRKTMRYRGPTSHYWGGGGANGVLKRNEKTALQW